jgi:hypothetical protein
MPLGVLFPYAGIRGGLLIHDGHFPNRSSVLKQRQVVFEVDGRRYIIERYLHVLASIKDSGWNATDECYPRETWIAAGPLLRKVKGSGRDKLVLTALIDILNGSIEKQPDWTGRVELIVRVDGERWICITQQEIADFRGLSVCQVRRALNSLKRQGALKCKKRGSEHLYRIEISG